MITLRNGGQRPQAHLWLTHGRISLVDFVRASIRGASIGDDGYMKAEHPGAQITRDGSGAWQARA